MERDPAGVAAHGLDDLHAVVALRGRLDALDRFGDHGHRGVEADRAIGPRHVVVDRLGDADDRQAVSVEPLGDAHRAVAAQDDQAVQTLAAAVGDDLGGGIGAAAPGVGEGIHPAVGAQHGAAHAQQSAHRAIVEGADAALDRAEEAVLHAHHLGAMAQQEALGRRANDRVQSRAVAAGGEDADPHTR